MAVRIVEIATEQTSAVTDGILAVVALGGAAVLARLRPREPWRVSVWVGVFGLVALAAFGGTIAHGIEMTDRTRQLVWVPINLSLGMAVALFAIAGLSDWRGVRAAGRALPAAVGMGLAFFALTLAVRGTFLVFIAYESVALIFALIVYSLLAPRRLPGARWISVAVAMTMIASVIQATGIASLGTVRPLDHNGIFHLVQAAALVVLAIGVWTRFWKGGQSK